MLNVYVIFYLIFTFVTMCIIPNREYVITIIFLQLKFTMC